LPEVFAVEEDGCICWGFAGSSCYIRRGRGDFFRRRAVGIMYVVAAPGEDGRVFVAYDAGAVFGLYEFSFVLACRSICWDEKQDYYGQYCYRVDNCRLAFHNRFLIDFYPLQGRCLFVFESTSFAIITSSVT